MKRALPVIAIVLVVVTVVAAKIYVRVKQLETAITIRAQAWAIETRRDDQGTIDPTAIREEVQSVGGGRDSWGRAVRVFIGEGSKETSYVLVSSGADGRFSSEEPEKYFTMPEHPLEGYWSEDIVCRNGRLVTVATK